MARTTKETRDPLRRAPAEQDTAERGAHGHEEMEKRHLWMARFDLAEYQRKPLFVRTVERSFSDAEEEALYQQQTLHQDWPGPVELTAIEYLVEL